MSRVLLARLAVSVVAAATLACVPALRGVARLPSLPPGVSPIPASEADAALGEAARMFDSGEASAVARARELWRAVAASDPTRVAALVGIAQASVWLVDRESEPQRREEDAALAVSSARVCTDVAQASAACWYWLGAALGIQAREKPATGIAALPAIVTAFERALALDPDFDRAGPDRALALVFLRAPGWPVGPGDPDRGLGHAREAVRRHPDAPQNLLALAEALTATDDPAAGRAAYERALFLARERAGAGDRQASEWVRQAQAALEPPR